VRATSCFAFRVLGKVSCMKSQEQTDAVLLSVHLSVTRAKPWVLPATGLCALLPWRHHLCP
jgi:hypothetical protein